MIALLVLAGVVVLLPRAETPTTLGQARPAVDPRNGILLAAVNEALGSMVADGTYDRIYDRYGAALPPGGRITSG